MPRSTLVAALLAAWCLAAVPGADARMPYGPHVRSACDGVTLIAFSDGHCHGAEGEDGCHGIVIIVASDDTCRGGDATARQTAGNGCDDAIVINAAGNDNCQGGDG